MTEVGIRELRDNLSRYLDRIQRGEEVVITDRGRAVARMLPMSGERTIDRLIREGRVAPASTRARTLPKRITPTRAVSPLVEEPGSDRCADHWSTADRIVSVRLVVVEARAAMAQAHRQQRITGRQRRIAVDGLGELLTQMDLIDLDDALVSRAAELAEAQALRAYDAVHLAAALSIADDDVVLVAGDRAL